ncbi:MAG: bifunctional pyr operon transcriptional regulator/uracil phosphoribosyltransferase PyrR [Deltaproteobacteria bacterium]|nr:bifunctional pyr operon transcriptional regulator/uracil phosphoribosyltransferase PyrR [Deltaproteobacteria bacterium]
MRMKKKIILNAVGIQSALERMSSRIVADFPPEGQLVLIGIRTGGAFLADRLRNLILAQKNQAVLTGALDITLYRDDWTRINHKPIVGKTEVPVSLDNQFVILVDDVLYTGRTVRSALDALIDFGRPRRIALAVLVDRGGRELPICADYVGIQVEATAQERVNVYFKELKQSEQVVVEGG